MNTYYMIMASMAAMAVVVFVALFFFKAGYGYLSNSNWGPVISNKVAWVLMEAPSFCFMLYYTLAYAFSPEAAQSANSNLVLYVLAAFFLLHYFQRSFIFPFLMRGKSKMPVAVMLMGLVFNTLNAYMIQINLPPFLACNHRKSPWPGIFPPTSGGRDWGYKSCSCHKPVGPRQFSWMGYRTSCRWVWPKQLSHFS